MKITNIIQSECVMINLRADSRDGAIQEVISRLATTKGIDVAVAVRDVLARESQLSTLIPVGSLHTAVPHALTTACKQCVMAIVTSPDGISWNGGGAHKANVIFLFIVPPHMRGLYLRMLSRISRFCAQPGFVETLARSGSPADVIQLLMEAEAPLGELDAPEGMPRFCVLGAGNGGLAMAAHLALSGCTVNLWNRTEARLRPIHGRGGVDATGEIQGFAALNIVTADAARAIQGVDILMVVVPATAHREVAEVVAPHIRDGQTIILNPGRTGGALEVTAVIRRINPTVRPYVAEAQTLLYASRITNPAQVHVFGIKNSVPLAALPAYQTVDILPVITKVLPQFVPGDNVLKTSLDNIGAVFHPAITILNAARIEDTHGDFEYYVEGVTPAVANVLEAIDRERVAVAGALGIRASTAREWLYLAYDAAGKTLFEAMRANTGYFGIKAPPTVTHRYIWEDVPASLVPIASIGEMLNVPTPNIRAVIQMASCMHGVDYWKEGRTVDKLGIKGMSVKDIQFLVVGADAASMAPAGAPEDPKGVARTTVLDSTPRTV